VYFSVTLQSQGEIQMNPLTHKNAAGSKANNSNPENINPDEVKAKSIRSVVPGIYITPFATRNRECMKARS
jgi:hypothetical protein